MSSKTTNESLLEAAPNAMGVDQAGVIRFVNHQTELLFGYDRGDLQGQPIERLARESFRKVHPAHRAGYFSDPKTQAMEAGPELTGLKAARQLKELAPQTKTILFTAHA